jgi:hypothetical protein
LADGAAAASEAVFINCPFDAAYRPIFRALIFAIFACHFRARSALELDDASQTRIDKLFRLVGECRYGIHDLCRTELDPAHGLPRFNMPLELGIFLGAKRYGGEAQKAKRALILDVDRFRYQRFISDLAGMDIHEHGGDPVRAVREVRDWLANVSRRVLPSADTVVQLHTAFLGELPDLARAFGFDPADIPYVDYERMVAGWLLDSGPRPAGS